MIRNDHGPPPRQENDATDSLRVLARRLDAHHLTATASVAEAWGAGRTLAAVVEGAAWRERAVALGRGVGRAPEGPCGRRCD